MNPIDLNEIRQEAEGVLRARPGSVERMKTFTWAMWRGFASTFGEMISEREVDTVSGGIVAQFTFADGKRYEVTVREVRE